MDSAAPLAPSGLPWPVSYPTGRKRRRRLYLPFAWEAEGYAGEVPAGFECNGGSIPRVLWGKYRPFSETTEPSFWVHDYLYGGARHDIGRGAADRILRDLQRQYGVDRIDRTVIYRAVRLFGGRHWKGQK